MTTAPSPPTRWAAMAAKASMERPSRANPTTSMLRAEKVVKEPGTPLMTRARV